MSTPAYILHVKKGDTARAIADTLTLGGVAINLTGCTVVLVWAIQGGATSRKAASITDAVNGQVSYALVAGDVAAAARVSLEWEITFADTTVLTVPTKAPFELHIHPDLG